MYKCYLINEESYKSMKNEMLQFNFNETEYHNLEGNEWVDYFTEAFDELFTLFKIGAITDIEFEEHYKLLKCKPKFENN